MDLTTDLEQLIRELAPDAEALRSDADLLEAGLIDSLAIVQLITLLEERYGVVVGDDDLKPENFRSIDTIVRFIEARKGAP